MEDRPQDPSHIVASLAKQGLSLELNTVDLCFVAALYLRAERASLASFAEDQLVDVFEQVCSLLDGTPETARKRATHSIRRLRDQRLLARIDGAGVVRAGEYSLTRLATGIVEFFLQEEALTRESLTVLTHTLLTNLTEILESAKVAPGPDEWRATVIVPLRITVGDLVAGIARRQRGFDLQQEEFQKEIAHLLEADWFGAVERCQSLLESTSVTLRELNQVLLRDTHDLQALLQDIQDLAVTAKISDAENTTRGVSEQVDRIAAWGSARQGAWSEYYQYVHRYLRDVVRLDPSRTLIQRLREQLSGRSGKPFALTIAAAPAMRLLRPVEPPGEPPPVKRPKKERDPALIEAAAENPHAELEARVGEVLSRGASGLTEVTLELTTELAADERYVAVGRIAHAVARLTRPLAKAERAWLPLTEGLEIEEWKLPKAGGDT